MKSEGFLSNPHIFGPDNCPEWMREESMREDTSNFIPTEVQINVDGSENHSIACSEETLETLNRKARKWYKKLAKRKRGRFLEFVPIGIKPESKEGKLAMYTGQILIWAAEGKKGFGLKS